MNRPVLVFDLDDTLIPSERFYAVALSRVGIDPEGEEYRNARQAVKDALPPRHPSARNRLSYFKRLLEERGEFSPRRLLTLIGDYEQALQSEIQAFWSSERTDILRTLAVSNDLCLLTNENLRTQLVKISAFDPHGELFPRVLTSEEGGAEKPDRALFDRLERSFPASSYALVGDHWQNDISPALERGWKAVRTSEFATPASGTSSLALESKCEQIAHLRELIYIFK